MGKGPRPSLALRLLLATGLGGGALYRPGAVRSGRGLRGPLDPPAQGADGRWCVEPDVTLFHLAAGAGRPALVLHGGPGIPGDQPWTGLAAVEGFAFHYFHQRGCGRSSRPFDAFRGGSFLECVGELERTLGLGAQVADVERIRRLLGPERLVLVGHSFGALVAALYAAEFPERVSALVLESPADLLEFPSERGGLFAWVAARLPPARRAEYGAWLRRYLDFGRLFERDEGQLAALHLGFRPWFEVAVGSHAAGAPRPAPRTQSDEVGGFMPQAVYLSMGRKHDWRGAVGAVRAPVLVLHGERDLQPLAATEAVAACFPGAELRVIPGATHFAHAEQPDAFAREVRAFLARVA